MNEEFVQCMKLDDDYPESVHEGRASREKHLIFKPFDIDLQHQVGVTGRKGAFNPAVKGEKSIRWEGADEVLGEAKEVMVICGSIDRAVGKKDLHAALSALFLES